MIPRLFLSPAELEGESVLLGGEARHYLGRVLRMRAGMRVELLDGQGGLVAGEIMGEEDGGLRVRVLARHRLPMPPTSLTLYQALPKGDKLELVIQKATELGVSRIVPVAAARCEVKLSAERAEGKLTRWRKIAQEAAEQSERATVPVIEPPRALSALGLEGLAYVLSERDRRHGLLGALPEAPPEAISLFVGPEGGWSSEELSWLSAHGARPVSLGPRILRTETAALAAIAVLMAAYEQR